MSETNQGRILIVEDEADIVAYLAAFFSDNGYEAISAGDGREGFLRAKSERPDLITLDITMPNESGVRMFRDLQEDSDTARIPVIVITGISPEFKRFLETRKHLRPPAGYFEKPIDRAAVLSRIREVLQR